jgi:hypothetical protein
MIGVVIDLPPNKQFLRHAANKDTTYCFYVVFIASRPMLNFTAMNA